MNFLPLLAVAGMAALALWLWPLGGMVSVERWAAQGQREMQNAMAGMLRRLKGGDPAALWTLWGLSFAYGFFHAAGPGHGKVLIGGYGLGRRIPVLRLSGLAVASSLAQAATAVGMVYAGVFVLNWTRQQMVDTAERILAPVSYGLIALIGLWLLIRGARRLWAMRGAARDDHPHEHDHAHHHPHDHAHDHAHHHPHDHAHDHAHDHVHDETCGCGHKHGPSAEEAANVHSLREALILVGSVAVRPCTGALFLLILTWRMGLEWVGIAGAFAMGLGTASVTVAVAVLATVFRESSLASADAPAILRYGMPLLELIAGALVVALSLQLMLLAL
ncbi:nickel/cobalt transporter [Thalassobius sp. S69A]|uniref:nickel/cobalt transporter n=1 Tax=unclassified Thalassovita TaxID=2619711 RepID=UPI003C7B122E